MSAAGCLIGIDLGTTGVRAAAYTAAGERLAEATVAVGHRTPAPGRAEADPGAWWAATRETTRRLVAGIAPRPVVAVGVVGQAPTAVLVDGAGAPVRPAILWLDARADERVTAADPAWRVARNRPHPYFLGPKLAWLRAHEPGVLDRAWRVLQSHAYVVFRLTGEASIDDSTAALCAPLWDPVARAWMPDASARFGIPARLLPPVRAAEEVVGTVTAEAAAATGLAPGVPVVAGGGDFAAAALSAGVVEQGEACLMLGTAGNLLMPLRTPGDDPRLINSHHVGCRRYLTLGGTLAGAVQQWFLGAVAPGVGLEALDAEAAAVPAGSGGLLLLPHLAGERTPLWNSRARGVFLGLGLEHGRGHLYRALLEGVALSFRHCQVVMAERGLALGEVVAANGGGRSALWRQILADVLGVPLLYAPRCGGTVAGGALLAGLGTGAVAAAAAARRWRGDVVAHAPDARTHDRYARLFELRLRTYESLRERFEELHPLAAGEGREA